MSYFSTVFIVDDDEITRFLLMTKLEDYSFADRYHAFDSAQEALTFLARNKEARQQLPDLIFLDINMPGMDSWEFLENYETIVSAFPKKVRVCILTSSMFEKDIKQASMHPLVDEYLVKPVQQASLEALVEKYAAKR